MSKKKVAFITGGNRGLGFETARELGEQGITVVIGSRNQDAGQKAAASLREKDIDAESIRLDVSNEQDRIAAQVFLEKEFGRLDILVNNAGHSLEGSSGEMKPHNTTLTVSMEMLRETYEVNFFGIVDLTRRLLPLVRKAPAGRIVNVSSILGSLSLHADPNSPLISEYKSFAYDSSKSALNAFTIHLAHALRDTKIKVNSAHPGWVKTELGGANATLEVGEGGKTSAALALLGEDGPTGRFLHRSESVPW
jgi:NAD(P)-dependent dehydrogenase (short-subunit alcohol dehydrogenase family)